MTHSIGEIFVIVWLSNLPTWTHGNLENKFFLTCLPVVPKKTNHNIYFIPPSPKLWWEEPNNKKPRRILQSNYNYEFSRFPCNQLTLKAKCLSDTFDQLEVFSLPFALIFVWCNFKEIIMVIRANRMDTWIGDDGRLRFFMDRENSIMVMIVCKITGDFAQILTNKNSGFLS
jgi:hypothetical protein